MTIGTLYVSMTLVCLHWFSSIAVLLVTQHMTKQTLTFELALGLKKLFGVMYNHTSLFLHFQITKADIRPQANWAI